MSKPRQIREWKCKEESSGMAFLADPDDNERYMVREDAAELAFYSRVTVELERVIELLECEGNDADVCCVETLKRVLRRTEKKT